MKKLADIMKPGQVVHWRQNCSGNDHPWEGSEVIPFYSWDIHKNLDFCERYGFRLDKWIYDAGRRSGNKFRMYAEWVKL